MPVTRVSEVPPPDVQQGGSTEPYLPGPTFGAISYSPSSGAEPCPAGQVFLPTGGTCINPDLCYGNCVAGETQAASGLPEPTLGTRGGREDAGQLAVEEPTLGVRGGPGGEPPGPTLGVRGGPGGEPPAPPTGRPLVILGLLGALAYAASRPAAGGLH